MDRALFDVLAEVELTHWWFVARRKIMRAILEAILPPGEGHMIVDVGCATGANVASLADAYTGIGIDTSPPGIALAQQRFPNTEYICGFAPEDLSELAHQADCYMLLDVLEHVEDDAALLAPLVDALKPGGYVLITVPADMKLWSGHDESFGHFRRYDPAMLRSIWTDLPVHEIMLSHFVTRLYWPVRFVRALSRTRGKPFGQAGSDLRVPAAPINAGLERLFRGERKRLIDLVSGRHARPYHRGVSLIALLRKEPAA